MKKKILALDMDGTLLNSRKEITPATRAALRKIMEEGHRVILSSGRPTPGLRPYERELELDRYGGYLLSFNGACITECRTGKILFQRLLPVELLPDLYDFARKNGCGLATHSETEAVSAFCPDAYISMEAGMNGFPVITVDNFVDFDVYKCLMTAEPERAVVLEGMLQERFGNVVGIYRSEPYYIEVVPRYVDKGEALERLAGIIGVEREDVVCCGDGYNDISMIKYAGVGVAMGNAQPEVKEAADYVTLGNDEDGLVEVIHKFIL